MEEEGGRKEGGGRWERKGRREGGNEGNGGGVGYCVVPILLSCLVWDRDGSLESWNLALLFLNMSAIEQQDYCVTAHLC